MPHCQLFYPKDFIETAEGLLFAVVAAGLEEGRIRCFLRYVRHDSGWQKYDTSTANAFLQTHYPAYLYYSPNLAAHLHGVDVALISQHHQPRQRLKHVMDIVPCDSVEQDLQQLGQLLIANAINLSHFGVTGSILPQVHNPESDIDLVCYDRTTFQQCRAVLRHLIAANVLAELSEPDWQASYQRRAADISYQDYVWHERRKHNKVLINGRKVDLSLLNETSLEQGHCQKLGAIQLQCQIVDDTYGFDYPACFLIDHPNIHSIISFTATYVGQAFTGEKIEVSGALEQTATGLQRIVVGSNREAAGEYIKVLDRPASDNPTSMERPT